MTKLRFTHSGRQVAVDIDPDSGKVTNHMPLRFRLSYGIEVNTGQNTFFMSRQQLEQTQLEVLTEILEAKQPGADAIAERAAQRAAKGQVDLVRICRSAGKLTHPDVLMLVDMRQNPNMYVNNASPHASMFNALSRKVMDMAFYATLNGPYPDQQRRDFIRSTGAVTRGMDQFIYYRPNASEASPYVNFSVIPAQAKHEELRYPTYYGPERSGSGEMVKQRIPKSKFIEIFAFYVNELFDCYRRYLRALGMSEIAPGNSSEDQASASVLADPPGGGPDEGGDELEALIEGQEQGQADDADRQAQSDDDAARAADDAERTRKEKKAYKKQKKARARTEAIKEAIIELKREQEAVKRQKKAAKTEPPVEDLPKRPVVHLDKPESSQSTTLTSSPTPSTEDIGSSSSFETPMDQALGKIAEVLSKSGAKSSHNIHLAITGTLNGNAFKSIRRADLIKQAIERGIFIPGDTYGSLKIGKLI